MHPAEQDAERAEAARWRLAQALLDDDRYHIEFNGHLTNHNKHAVVALLRLGATAERIQGFYDGYARMTPYGFGLEEPKPSTHRIGHHNWQRHLGERTSYSSYCAFFAAELERLGMTEALRLYVPNLVPGWMGALSHGAIHLGWALDVGNRCMIIEGLAYMAFGYVSCHSERALQPSPQDETVLASLLRLAEPWGADGLALGEWVGTQVANCPNLHPELVRSGLQQRIAAFLHGGHPEIYRVPGWLQARELPAWEELYHAITLIYLAWPGDFLMLHLLTALHAMEKLATQLPPHAGRQVMLNYWVGAMGCVYSTGRFPPRATLAALADRFAHRIDATDEAADWAQIVARATADDEEHNAKMVYVLRSLWERTGRRSLYREAAQNFTSTPILPESFASAPTET